MGAVIVAEVKRVRERIAMLTVVLAVVVVSGAVGQETCLDSVSCASSVFLGSSSNLFCKSFWNSDDVKVAYACMSAQDGERIDFVFRATSGYELTSVRAGLSSDCEAIPKAWSRFQSTKSSQPTNKLTLSVDLSEVTSTSTDGCCGNDLCMVFEAKVIDEGQTSTAAVYRVDAGGVCYKNTNGIVVCSQTLECEGCDDSLCADTATGKGTDEGCGADLPFCDSGDGKNMGDSAPGDTCRLCAGRGSNARVDWNCPDERPDCVDSSGSAVKWQELGDQCVCLLTADSCVGEEVVDTSTCLCNCLITEADCVGAEVFDGTGCRCSCPISQDDCVGMETFDASSCECLCPDVSGTDICDVGTELFDETSGICDCVACPIEFDQVGSDILSSAAGDFAGEGVAMSGDGKRVAVGSPFHDGSVGEVRVFEYDEAQEWIQLGLAVDGEFSNDRSGYTVAMSRDGNRVAIGSPVHTRDDDIMIGVVRVFEYDANNSAGWVQLGLNIYGEGNGDQSGGAVAISAAGDIVAIGATLNAATGTSGGHVRVFQYDLSLGWVQLGLDIDAQTSLDYAGGAVALSSDGMRVAIGAIGHDNFTGNVRVFDYDVSTGWAQVGQDIDGVNESDHFGGHVAMSDDGSRVAIGAANNNGNGEKSGEVQVYEFQEDTEIWTQVGQDINGEAAGDLSMVVEMSSDGTSIAVGAPYNTADGLGNQVGHVRLFELQKNGQWQQMGLDIDGEEVGDQAGRALALSSDGTRVAVASPLNQDNGLYAGKVRIFDMNYNCT